MGSLVLHLLSRRRYLLTSHFVGEKFESSVFCWSRVVETECGVFLVVARRGRSSQSADVLITKFVFLGVSVLDDLFVYVTFVGVSFVYVTIVDVVVYWTFWQTSSGAWST